MGGGGEGRVEWVGKDNTHSMGGKLNNLVPG